MEVISLQVLVEVRDEWMMRAFPRAMKVLKGESRRTTGFSNAEVKLLWEHGYEAWNPRGSLWSDGTTLYSYSTPIAVRCRNGLLVNTHYYSITTSHHRPIAEGAANVDFEILRRWITFSDLEKLHILDRDEDAVLLYKNSGDDHYILMLREDGREYGIKLPVPCRTVEGAKRLLVPEKAMTAMHTGRGVKRQGEWYFIEFPEMRFPTCMVEHALRKGVYQDRHLGNHIPRDNVAWAFSVEEAAELGFFEDSVTHVFVRGTVRHSRGDHRMLRLGDVWHLALRSPLRAVTASRGLD